MSYCRFANSLPAGSSDPNKHYHDHVYGFAVTDDKELFERLVLEINQAGLSWTLILRKQRAFQAAYRGFDIAAVAAFGDQDRERLLADAGIVRNRLKIDAAIHNARQILAIQAEHGSFKNWLDAHAAAAPGLDGWLKILQVRRPRNRQRISDEHRLPARRPRCRLPGCRPLGQALKRRGKIKAA